MRDRQELIRRAFAALDDGDIAPFSRLLDPGAEWVAIPQGGEIAGATYESPTSAATYTTQNVSMRRPL
jgi:ketosteroid isomerase-like protein